MATRKIAIEYDINSEDVRIAGEETLSLTQRVRILKKELQRGDLKPEQFDILRKKIGDYEDKIKSSTTRSRNFFEVLSTLPGPVGQFGATLNGVIETLKVLSSFSLKDIKNSVTDVSDDIGDITRNLGQFTENSKGASEATKQVTQSTNALGNSLQGAAVGAGAAAGATSQLAKETQLAVVQVDESGRAMIKAVKPIKDMSEAERELFTQQRNRIVHTGELTTKTNENSKSVDTNAKAVKGLGNAWKGLGAALGIGALIAGVTFLISKFIEWAQSVGEATEQQKAATKAVTDFKTKLFEVQNSIKAAKEGVISKKDALKEYNDKLGTTVGFANDLDEAERLLAANTDTVIQSIRLRAEAQVFYAKSAEAAAKAVSGEGLQPDFWDKTLNVFKSFGNPFRAVIYDVETYAENLKEVNEESAKFATEGDKLIKKALELEKTLQGTRTKPEDGKGAGDELYRKQLADLDARIQLEINKENTKSDVLEKLLEQRAQMVIAKEKYTVAQAALLREENSKKLEQALQEDSDRFFNFLQKRNEIMFNADKDEQVREESLLADKLYFDKLAISKETEFKKKGKEEQQQILFEMEQKYQEDLLKLKEKYFLKELDKQKEIDQRARENELLKGESILDINQQLLERKIKLSDYYEVLFTMNNKKLFEGYFVDLRDLYKQNFEDTQTSLMNELTQLQTATEQKKITQEEYEKRVRDINQALLENKTDYVQKVVDLDSLEKSSREAVVDKFSELAQRTVDFYNALIDIRQADMDEQMMKFDDQLELYQKDSKEYNEILEAKRKAEEENLEKIKKMQTAAALADAAVQIARVIIDTQRAIVSFAASVAPLGPAGIPIAAAYATASKVLAAVSIATITAQGIAKIKGIQSQRVTTEGGGGGASGNGMGRGYEKGGIIEGKRHSQGGTMIEAEGGEAVMTRGAVTMFRPLLSMMNQAGGGTSFNTPNGMVTLPDNPQTAQPNQEPIIMKTYVVESELTSSQQRQARLKDLSTL